MLARVARWAGYEGGRAHSLDVGRGVAIVSVMYGHALAPWFMAADGHFSEGAFLQWKFGGAFMMLFFFFLSGAGWREQRSLETTVRQAMALVLIALCASLVLDVVLLGASQAGWAPALEQPPLGLMQFARNAARMSVYGHDYSMSALWFLAALAVVRVLAALCHRAGRTATIAVAVLLLALTLAATEAAWRNFYQLHLIGVGFLAFLAGHAARGLLQQLERYPQAAFALMLVAGAITLATFGLNEGCRWDVTGRCPIGWLGDRFGVSMVIGQFGNLAMSTITGVAGVAFAISLSILLARFGGAVGERAAMWGRASLNLLIVNCLFLELVNPLLDRRVAPLIEGDHVLFFATLFAVMLAVNLSAAAVLARPLRALRSFASWASGRIVAGAFHVGAIVGWRGLRVSQRHD